MSDVPIPEDIRNAAMAVVERGYDEGLLDAVCRALMAERLSQKERDAKIADHRVELAREHSPAAAAALFVALPAAIRRGTP